MIIARYTLAIISQEVVDVKDGADWELREARVMADMPARLEEIEENLSDMLPEGYSARVIKNGGKE